MEPQLRVAGEGYSLAGSDADSSVRSLLGLKGRKLGRRQEQAASLSRICRTGHHDTRPAVAHSKWSRYAGSPESKSGQLGQHTDSDERSTMIVRLLSVQQRSVFEGLQVTTGPAGHSAAAVDNE